MSKRKGPAKLQRRLPPRMNSTAASSPSESSQTCLSFGYNGGHFQITTGVVVGCTLSSFLNAVGILAGVPGNILVILAISLNHSLRQNSEFVLLFLAVSDLLVSALLQPLMMARKIEALVLQRSSCAIVEASQVVFSIAATGSLVSEMWVGLERTVAVLAPYWYEQWISPVKLFAPPASAWLVSSLVLNSLWRSSSTKAANIVAATLGGFCLLLNVVCYGLLVKVANRHENQIQAQQRQFQPSEQERRNLRERKALWTAIYVNSTYFVSYIPAITVGLITATVTPAQNQNTFLLYVLVGTTVALPSVANPTILFWRNARVGREMKKLLGINESSTRTAVQAAAQFPPNGTAD